MTSEKNRLALDLLESSRSAARSLAWETPLCKAPFCSRGQSFLSLHPHMACRL